MGWMSFAGQTAHAVGCALALLCLPEPAIAQTELNPKIVPQTLPYGGVEVAAWTRGDKYIITASATTRTLLIWDATSGIIIDRLILPSDNPNAALSTRRLTSIETSEDGKTAIIHGQAVYATPDDPEGSGAVLRYELDLQSRAVTLTPTVKRAVRRAQRGVAAQAAAMIAANPLLAAIPDFGTVSKAGVALETIYEKTEAMDLQAAEALLPPLPKSHDGTRKLLRDPGGLIVEHDDGTRYEIKAQRNVRYSDVQMSPDGDLLAMVQQDVINDEQGKPQTKVDIFDLKSALRLNQIALPGYYSQAQWVFDDKLLISQSSDSNDRTSKADWAKGPPPAAIGVDAISGEIELQFETRCFFASAPEMAGFFGAGLANCRSEAGKDRGVQRFDPTASIWRPFGDLKLAADTVIENLTVSPSANAIAVSTRAKDGTIELVAMDGNSGEITGRMVMPGVGYISKLAIYDDGNTFVSGDGDTAFWYPHLGSAGLIVLPMRSVMTKMAESDGATVVVAGIIDDNIARWNLETNETPPAIEFSSVLAGGFLLDRPVFWAFSALEGLRYWDTTNWSEMLTLHFFDDGNFLAVTPQGRYDTSLGPDAKEFRWLVPDRPFQSLTAQTFMRDYFQPSLTERIANCSFEGNCASAFKPLPAIADLNRILPVVTITDVKTGDTPDQALVTIEVREGVDPDAPNGKTRSGVFNPRVFRDFRFAAHTPDSDFEFIQSVERWREVNRMPDDDDNPGDGVHTFQAVLYLPTAAGTEEQFISAYAFNEDRIKSETSTFVYTRPPMEARQPRAFVISIGVDHYTADGLDLSYAAKDARVMGASLAAIPGYETHTVIATSEKDGRSKVNADTIRNLLAMLNGDGERTEVLGALKADGIDASALQMVGPDDVVIITFSGHGWTQKGDDFYLLASDARWPDRNDLPDIGSLISSSELTMWLRMINAADIALIIDACHSGASVDGGDFKPGPLGDAGLGQLAYDKGIRILAATQADGVALEISNLEHGLLTYALTGNGEGLSRPDTDLNRDGKVSLSEWMAYPAWRLLDFNEDKRLTGGESDEEESVGFAFPGRSPVKVEKVQKPSFFNFTAPSSVVVKELTP
jgi:uncharacterized caspase-like protein